MRKIFLSVLGLCCSLFATLEAKDVVNENLTYDVMFKWGIIQKKAGVVELKTDVDPDNEIFKSMLVGRSTSIADRIYSVRDTMIGHMFKSSLEPVYYEKIAHEDGAFRRDVLKYDRDENGNVSATASINKVNKKGQSSQGEKLMTATGITLDMLSAFYYMRHLDYDQMKPGESVVFNIFSGQKSELLRITFLEETSLSVPMLDGQQVNVYHISFTFTYADHQQKKSSDPIEAWIGIDENRIPYQVTGKLPIGGILCVLSDSSFE